MTDEEKKLMYKLMVKYRKEKGLTHEQKEAKKKYHREYMRKRALQNKDLT